MTLVLSSRTLQPNARAFLRKPKKICNNIYARLILTERNNYYTRIFVPILRY